MAATKVQPIDSSETFFSVINSTPAPTLTVLYFHAPWAAPCAQMSTVLDALASTYPISDPPKVAFLSINAEELPDVSEEFDVTAVPFIVLRRDGKILETVSGGDPTKVRAAVEKHAGAGTSGGKPSAQLPPAQQVTRPDQQPTPSAAPPPAPTTNGTAKNLSAYKPTSDPAPAINDEPPTSPEALHARLKDLTTAAPCMLFMKGTPSQPQCGFSRQLVGILRQHSVRYGFFNILADEEVRQGLKEYADWPTFPQLWLSGELVGGLDIVKEELESDPDFFSEYVVDVKRKEMETVGQQQQAQATA